MYYQNTYKDHQKKYDIKTSANNESIELVDFGSKHRKKPKRSDRFHRSNEML